MESLPGEIVRVVFGYLALGPDSWRPLGVDVFTDVIGLGSTCRYLRGFVYEWVLKCPVFKSKHHYRYFEEHFLTPYGPLLDTLFITYFLSTQDFLKALPHCTNLQTLRIKDYNKGLLDALSLSPFPKLHSIELHLNDWVDDQTFRGFLQRLPPAVTSLSLTNFNASHLEEVSKHVPWLEHFSFGYFDEWEADSELLGAFKSWLQRPGPLRTVTSTQIVDYNHVNWELVSLLHREGKLAFKPPRINLSAMVLSSLPMSFEEFAKYFVDYRGPLEWSMGFGLGLEDHSRVIELLRVSHLLVEVSDLDGVASVLAPLRDHSKCDYLRSLCLSHFSERMNVSEESIEEVNSILRQLRNLERLSTPVSLLDCFRVDPLPSVIRLSLDYTPEGKGHLLKWVPQLHSLKLKFSCLSMMEEALEEINKWTTGPPNLALHCAARTEEIDLLEQSFLNFKPNWNCLITTKRLWAEENFTTSFFQE